MTDPTHDPQAQAEAELDELASAYLDGHASFEEARRVEHDRGLLARVERLRQARDAIRLPDRPVDLERREVAIAAAMAAAGHQPLTAVGSLTAVGDLAEVRARHEARRRWLPAVGIAAAIAIAALLVPRLGDDGDRDGTLASKAETFQDRATGSGLADDSSAADAADGDDSDRSSTASAEIGASAPSGAGEGSSESAGAGAQPGDTGPVPTTAGGDPATTTSTTGFTTLTTVVAPHVDLGAFEEGDVPKLREAAKAEADAPAAAAAKPTTAVDECLAQMEDPSQMGGASVIYTAIATVGDDEVVALVVQLESGRELRARYLDGCERWIDGATLG